MPPGRFWDPTSFALMYTTFADGKTSKNDYTGSPFSEIRRSIARRRRWGGGGSACRRISAKCERSGGILDGFETGNHINMGGKRRWIRKSVRRKVLYV